MILGIVKTATSAFIIQARSVNDHWLSQTATWLVVLLEHVSRWTISKLLTLSSIHSYYMASAICITLVRVGLGWHSHIWRSFSRCHFGSVVSQIIDKFIASCYVYHSKYPNVESVLYLSSTRLSQFVTWLILKLRSIDKRQMCQGV